MKKWKRIPATLFALVLVILAFAVPVFARDNDRPARITAVGSKKVTVTTGSEFELKVRMAPSFADDDYLSWSIVSGKSVVKFTDSDLRDDDVELKALRTGTARVRCKIRGTSQKITFTVTVKKASGGKKISAVGNRNRTVTAGDEFELAVKRQNVTENELIWSIVSGKSVVCFDDDDRCEDDIELKAIKAGTAKVRCTISGTGKKVDFVIKVKEAPRGIITAIGSRNRTVYEGQEFELEVKRGKGVRESSLRWTVADRSIVDFEDEDDRYDADDEMEFLALRTGTTTVTCKDTKSGSEVTFTVRVK